MPLRVLMWMKSEAAAIPGGHLVQFDRTAEALREAGLSVVTRTSEDWAEAPDIVHGFGLSAGQIGEAKRRGIPVVLSPIYASRSHYRTMARLNGGRETVRSFARQARADLLAALRLRSSWNPSATAAFCAADMLLPNARGEAAAICRELRVRTPMRVIPNGVDVSMFQPGGYAADRDRVVYVGRIEPHKNQLGLIEALRGTGLRLLVVGATHPHHGWYAARCREAASGEPVEFVAQVSQSELPAVYQSGRVHAMPSLFETTGLASLEAALCGASIVSTSAGWAREYFGEFATYCRPLSRESIRGAVQRAWDTGADVRLRERILANYTWQHTAHATLTAYQSVLAHRREARA
jgi:glycosyltransferase involved in cell wall biosynthesis